MIDKYLTGEFSWEMIGDVNEGRAHLGTQMPVAVYRLLQYTMRAVLTQEYGSKQMIELFRRSGRLAGSELAKNMLDLTLPVDAFAAQLQQTLKDLKIGVLRFESLNETSGKAILTVSEDLDCSGLPVSGECICNYDEGFIAGIMDEYTKKPYWAVEVDCWAKGDRICRFEAKPQES